MRIKYPQLLREILFNSDTGRDISDFVGISEEELIGILTGDIEITCNTAVKIKRIICSKLPLEELFEEVE